MFRKSLAAAIIMTSVLTACGGGGGGDDNSAVNGEQVNLTCTQSGNTTNCTSQQAGGNSAPSSPRAGSGGAAAPSPAPSSGDSGSGDSGSGDSGSDGGATPGSTPPSPPSDNSGSPTPAPGTPPATTPLAASVRAAPADGATLSGTVRLDIQGSAIGNAELLPADGYAPLLGRFTVSGDKTTAFFNFNTGALPNGVLLARISAFDQSAGTGGTTEIVAMAPRRWTLANSPAPAVTEIPPASLMPQVHISNLALPYVDPAPLATMMQMEDAAYEAMLQNEWARVEGEMLRYIPAHVVLFPPTPIGFSGPWYSCLDNHTRAACREAMNNMIGLMRGKQS